jgi:hypothetical protein
VRLGVNSGPVVADIIGRNKFIYNVWGCGGRYGKHRLPHGDLWNSRPHSTAQVTHTLIESVYRCGARGVIDVRSGGPITLNLLIGAAD